MRKHIKLVAIAVAAMIVLTVGLTTVAFAESSGDGGSGVVNTFISKVASILGLGEEQVADAFEQARDEMRDEAQGQCLQDAVEEGRITEQEADQIRQWLQDRPEALDELGPCGRFQARNAWHHQWLQRHGPCGPWTEQSRLGEIFDEQVSGTIASVSEDEVTITVATEDGSEVAFQYTSNTRFVLEGVTAVAAGQTATALCWEDAEGDLTAKVVKVELPQDEEVAEDGEVT
ncbi:MAG: hypothetical protein ISS53_00510 [Dehalococcoidia bacterium]|nr:hypothetical protein [Dehalococcoidia bacterium]